MSTNNKSLKARQEAQARGEKAWLEKVEGTALKDLLFNPDATPAELEAVRPSKDGLRDMVATRWPIQAERAPKPEPGNRTIIILRHEATRETFNAALQRVVEAAGKDFASEGVRIVHQMTYGVGFVIEVMPHQARIVNTDEFPGLEITG